MLLGQVVALVVVNKYVKFHWFSFSIKEVMTKIKVCNAAAYDNDDDRVITLPQFFFSEKQTS